MAQGVTSKPRLKRIARGLETVGNGAGKKALPNVPKGVRVDAETRKGMQVAGFDILSPEKQRLVALQAQTIAVRNSPRMVQVLVDIADGTEPGRPADRIAAASKVLDLAQVIVPAAEKPGGDRLLSEKTVGELESFLTALRQVKEQQTVTVDGAAERVSTDWRQSSVNQPPTDAEIIDETTACDGRQPDSHSAPQAGERPDGSTEAGDGGGQPDG